MEWSKLFWSMATVPVKGSKKYGKYKVYEIPATEGSTYYYIDCGDGRFMRVEEREDMIIIDEGKVGRDSIGDYACLSGSWSLPKGDYHTFAKLLAEYGRKGKIVDKDTGIRWRMLDLPNYYTENYLAREIYEEMGRIHIAGRENNRKGKGIQSKISFFLL